MKNEYDFENLFVSARAGFVDMNRVALAVSDKPTDIVLIGAACEVLSADNILVITADCGCISDESVNLIKRACELANVNNVVIPVYIDESHDRHSYEYKQALFKEILHEAWTRGFDTVADGCMVGNLDSNGNSAQHNMGVLSPFCTDVI